jgi:hypothetical protein
MRPRTHSSPTRAHRPLAARSPSASSAATAYPAQPRIPFTRFLTSPRTLLLPSVRLKSALYALSLAVILLIYLAVSAARLSAPNPLGVEGELNTVPAHTGLGDSGAGAMAAKGKDGHLLQDEVQRSFEEPDFALLSGRQPHEIGCDVPLAGESGEIGKLVFLGIFSAAGLRQRRDL